MINRHGLRLALVLMLLFACGSGGRTAAAQDAAALQGRIIDAETGEALPGVNVFLAYTAFGASSGSTGAYRIDRVPPGSYELVASMIGYEPQVRQVEVAQSGTLTVDFRLTPTVYGLDEVAVTAERDRAWQERYEQFEQLFLGTTANAEATEILNPEVLDFAMEAGVLTAQAAEPLRIENRALGYRITFVLERFRADTRRDQLNIAGFPHFEELEPRDDDEAAAWHEARRTTFQGSLQHLLWALVHGRVDQEGFHLRSVELEHGRLLLTGDPVEPDAIIRATPRSYEYELQFDDYLMVNHAPPGRRMVVSNIRVTAEEQREGTFLHTSGPVTIHETGYHHAGSDVRGTLTVSGYLGKNRMADMLPREYPAQFFGQEPAPFSAGAASPAPTEVCTGDAPPAAAVFAYATEEYSDAIERETKRIEANPDDLGARYRRGVLYAERSKDYGIFTRRPAFNKAKEDFEYILARDSLFKDVLYQYARLYRFREDYPAALRLAHQQVRLKPESEVAHMGLVRLYRQFLYFGKPAEVQAWLDAHPSDYATYFTAELLRRQGRLKAANALLRSMLDGFLAMPVQPILLSRARIHYALGYPDVAQGFVEQAVATIRGKREALLVFDHIKYIVTPEELAAFEALCTAAEYQAFFETFWARRDPMPSSGVNLRIAEHYRRLDKAEADYLYYGFRDLDDLSYPELIYRFPVTHALAPELDDRGIVYLRHGDPDDIVVTVGEKLRTDGKLGGSGPLKNESWLYNNPDLLFHFYAPTGAATMRLAAYVPSGRPASLDDQNENLLGERGIPGVDRSWYLDRRSWGAKRLGFDIYDMEQRAQANIDIGLTTDHHTWPPETEHLEIPYQLAAFRGPNGRTLLELYYALPLHRITEALPDTTTPRVEVGVALQDGAWRAAAVHREIKPLPRSEDPSAQAVDVLRLVAPPDSFRVAFHGRPLQQDHLVGAYQFDYRVPDYTTTALAMSDVILAYTIEPAVDDGRFVKNDLVIEANPGGGFYQHQPIYLYFEVYNLTYAGNDRTRYTISYTLTPHEREGLLAGLLSRDDGGVALTSSHEGSSRTAIEYSAIDISEVRPGTYDLHVEVHDEGTGAVVRRTRTVEIRGK